MQCLVCAREYKALGTHLIRTHSMSTNEYKVRFGLRLKTALCDPSTSLKMRVNALRDRPHRFSPLTVTGLTFEERSLTQKTRRRSPEEIFNRFKRDMVECRGCGKPLGRVGREARRRFTCGDPECVTKARAEARRQWWAKQHARQ